VRYRVEFYYTQSGEKPVAGFITELRVKHPDLHKLVKAGTKKLEDSQYHREPLTKQVDPDYGIFELRVGGKNIARVFWFFRPGRVIILTSGYVKKTKKLDSTELQRARDCKTDWEERAE
jgi:hypothetical protein